MRPLSTRPLADNDNYRPRRIGVLALQAAFLAVIDLLLIGVLPR